MIDKRHIVELRDRVRQYRRPVLSLYATVNPARAEINPQAVYVRVKNTLRQLEDVPADIADRVLHFFGGRAHDSRSIALFADAERLDAVELEVEFLQDVAEDHVEAHWGEPYFTPLLVAMDDYEPYGVLYVDRDHLRFFEVFMGRIDELHSEHREPLGGETDELGTSSDRFPAAVTQAPSPSTRSPMTASSKQQLPDYLADRGDAARQLADEHLQYLQGAFYRDNIGPLLDLMEHRGIGRLIIKGPDADAHHLLSLLPPKLAGRVVALTPAMSSPRASAQEVLERVEPLIKELESTRERELIDEIRERGMWGLDRCLHALQEGRLHTIAIPEALHQDVFVETGTNYVALNENEVRGLDGGDIERVDLADKLPELAAAWGARVEFVSGDAERTLLQELGGMGGLRRW